MCPGDPVCMAPSDPILFGSTDPHALETGYADPVVEENLAMKSLKQLRSQSNFKRVLLNQCQTSFEQCA